MLRRYFGSQSWMKWLFFEEIQAYTRFFGSISYMHRKEVGYFEALKSLTKIQKEKYSN